MSKSWLLAVIISCVVIFFTSGYADTSNNFEVNSSVQTAGLSKTKVKMDDSIIGGWGGKHISLEISDKGASIEYDCGHGTINKKILPDKNNRFDVLGTQIDERGGPIRENGSLNSYPVRFIGRIKGKRMTLIVKRKGSNKVIGKFSLTQGQEPLLVKCR